MQRKRKFGVRELALAAMLTAMSVVIGIFCKTVLNFAEGCKLADIPKQAFSDCTALVAVNIPSTVKTVGTAAFLGCSSLARVKAAEGVEIIGSQAFQNCTALKQVIMPASVVSIGSLAFSGSENLYAKGVSCPENSVAAEFFAAMKLEEKPAA